MEKLTMNDCTKRKLDNTYLDDTNGKTNNE